MTNLYLTTPVYISLQDVRDTTTDTNIQALSDDDISILIDKAQREVDNYIKVCAYKSFTSSQLLIFPISINEVSTLPTEISIATLQVLESIYNTSNLISNAMVKKETTGPHTIEYVVGEDPSLIPDTARDVLDNYKTIFMKSSL